MDYAPTSRSARDYEEAGRLEEWIHLFLLGEGNNRAFSEGLHLRPRLYAPPRMMELSAFVRCCGPETHMKYRVDEAGFNKRVQDIMARYRSGSWDMPPLIVQDCGGHYDLNDGNHRYEALTRLGISAYWTVVWSTVGE